jgi:hypothetical protein
MKKIIFMLLILFTIPLHIFCEDLPEGLFVGLEPEGSSSPDDIDMKWFRECYLKIKDGKVTLRMVPVNIKNGEKAYSASDGGFFTYAGIIFKKSGKFYLNLTLIELDYVALALVIDPEAAKKYPDYKKWPAKKQREMGILVTPTPKPYEKRIIFTANGCVFDGVKYIRNTGKTGESLMEPVK